MGITSSTDFSTRNNNNPEKPPLSDRPEPVKTAVGEVLLKEFHAMFPPKLGDDTKEGGTEREEEAEKRFFEFMRGGRCKEAFNAVEDCLEQGGIPSGKCDEQGLRLIKCIDAHHDYYHPLLSIFENTEQQLTKDLQAQEDSKKRV